MDDKLKQWIRPELFAAPPYRVELPDVEVKLNQNESPWDWPPEIKREYYRRLEAFQWNRYPHNSTESLRLKLARSLNVRPNQIVLANGSNEVLAALANLTLSPGDQLCTVDPGFAVYDMLARWRGATMDKSPLDSQFQSSTDDLISRSANARLTILCNPNSPTGSLISTADIAALSAPNNSIIVIDEAYHHFSGGSALSLLDRRPNLVITQTFSKAFAMAGFRIGYGVMSASLAEQVAKTLLPFNLDGPSAIAAEVALDNLDWVDQRVSEIMIERDMLIAQVNEIDGATALPSQANFFLMQTNLSARETFTTLLQNSILVRDVTAYRNCENYVRVTVGSRTENNRLLTVIRGMV